MMINLIRMKNLMSKEERYWKRMRKIRVSLTRLPTMLKLLEWRLPGPNEYWG
jgi:hypothetical protein